jgi:MFS family permease
MLKLRSFLFLIFLMSPSGIVFAGGGAPKTASNFDWKNSSMVQVADQFVQQVSTQSFQQAYDTGGDLLRKTRAVGDFGTDLAKMGLARKGTVKWENGIPALPANNGYKLTGTFTLEDGSHSFPVYLHVEGDSHIDPEKRNRKWTADSKWTVLDYRSARSMFDRISMGDANGLDWFLMICMVLLILSFLGMVGYYVLGLRGSPRELYLMFFTKVTEYSAYGAASVVMVKYLSQDVLLNGQSLGDTDAYLFYGVWSLTATIITIMVGSVCDTIGIKKCLLIGAFMLLIARFIMPMSQDLGIVSVFGFLPLAFGFAITGPVLKVGIKRFTTVTSATLGFGLFYTLMNVGFFIGAEIADWFRATYSDTGTVAFLGIDALEITTYQAIIGVGFLINIPDLLAILWMRDGAEMTEEGFVIHAQNQIGTAELTQGLTNSVDERVQTMFSELKRFVAGLVICFAIGYLLYILSVHTWMLATVVPIGRYIWAIFTVATLIVLSGLIYATLSLVGTRSPGQTFDRVMKSVRDATEGTVEQLKENFTEKAFWVYMGMLAILVFVRLTFYIFHVMFPTYAIRVFGADFPVASIFGSLNPAMIVFLVPLIAMLTTKVSSYKMLLIGTFVSAGSVFICFMPESMAQGLADTWFGEWILDYWLEAPEGNRDPFLISLVTFIIVFTVGEAIWSPRLMQFSAEIAPIGKEGAYIALAMLPYFLGKMGATIVSEQLTTNYFNASQVAYPDHTLSWLWIGSMAMLSPIGLMIFAKTFLRREEEAKEIAKNRT